MKKIKDFLDKRQYLIQKSDSKINCIDSNFLTTNIALQKFYLGENWVNGDDLILVSKSILKDYSDRYGVIRRYYENFDKLLGSNPEETKRYKNPNHVSRDNSMGYLMLSGHIGKKGFVRQFIINMLKRGSFFQNTHTVKGEKKLVPDFCGPSQYALLLRAGLPQPLLILLYPLLLIVDFFYLLSYTFHVLQSWYDPTHTSTVPHMLSGVLTCRSTIQTPFSYLAEKVFINYRKQVPNYEDKEPIVSALKYYSRKPYDPPIYLVGERVLRRLRDNEV